MSTTTRPLIRDSRTPDLLFVPEPSSVCTQDHGQEGEGHTETLSTKKLETKRVDCPVYYRLLPSHQSTYLTLTQG